MLNHFAEIAQLVERNLAKVNVASSSLVSRSKTFNLIWGYSSVWESDALALRRSAVRSRLSPPLNYLNIGNYIVEQTRKKINSNNFLELAVKKIG